ncbi:MAG: TIGR04255 family protein [Anaerolineales bacterium]|uniref:TIGR04255 family protein n=1 Tax=candidate division WWE3 bacterium TaxID=2053526 RepID=A0A955LVX9_UNCKA|nr:TIGR04255 family protein [candidate division WWE3 bacterium]MCA9951345.1 TIGR04255 family protein [Anaerolineales bacterium]
MSFPNKKDVVYNKAPLKQVICQLRFPRILRIDSRPPEGFQERIRDRYPLYEQGVLKQRLGPLTEILSDDVVKLLTRQDQQTYDFISVDGNWSVGLTSEFVALSTSKYSDWNTFVGHLQHIIYALQTEFEPAFFTRIGLRYQNVISQKELGLDNNISWIDLIDSSLTGILSGNIKVSPNAIIEENHVVIINLGNEIGKVKIQYGIKKDVKVQNRIIDEGYILDNDLFIDNRRIKADEVINRLHNLNEFAGRIFQASITDKLYNALEPRERGD